MTQKRILLFYVATVLVVFVGLMVAVFNQSTDEVAFLELEEDEIVAIIEEYRGNDVARVSVSINEIASVVPVKTEPAWQKHAAAPIADQTQSAYPKIAIIIDDLGLDQAAAERLGKMQGPLTLAFLPYADELEEQTLAMRAAGHELMVHLPMQSHRASADPGDNALLTNLSFDEFGARVDWNLNRFDGFVGVNNHMGSLLTEDPALMVRLMARLRSEGLLFVDSLTTPRSMGERAAKALGVPFVARDIFLDNEQDEDYILRQLASTEKIAQMRGYAIAIGHPYTVTLDVLEKWQDGLAFKGFELVPISKIMTEALARQKALESR